MHTSKNYLQNITHWSLMFILALVVAGCGENPTRPDGRFDANSWRTLIPESCQTYFDGCNNCTRDSKSGETVCTRDICQAYQQPKCLDGEEGVSVSAIIGPRVVKYRCADNKRFTIHYGEYAIADKKVPLKTSQVMFVDGATRIAEVMTQQPSASGEKFVSGATTLLTRDKEALVNKRNNIYYARCVVQEAN